MVPILLALLLLGPSANSAIVETELSVMCRLSKQVRTLRVEKLDNGSCRTVYTKAGKDQSIGNAQNQNSCEEILQKVRGVLESADWKCREVKESRVSNIIEVR